MKVVYMCHVGFKNMGLDRDPLLKIGGFQNWPTRGKGVLELILTKKHTFFCKVGSFRAAQVEKVETLGAAKDQTGELLGSHTCTVSTGVHSPGLST